MSGNLPRTIARVILEGFNDYRSRFTEITLGARDRFLQADWPAAQQAASDRINLYDHAVRNVMTLLDRELGSETDYRDSSHWSDVRDNYIDQVAYRTDPELAETFYNSIYRKMFRGEEARTEDYFVQSAFDDFRVRSARGIYRSYFPDQGLVKLVGHLLDDFQFEVPWEYRRRDIRNIIMTLREAMPELLERNDLRVDVLQWVFYRNKAAYLIGRIVAKGGELINPFVMPVLNNERGGLYVDTLLCNNDDVSVLFSFTRSYFNVDARIPSECIDFLHSLLPAKSSWEMYSSIGFFKHGKTVFYRDFLLHLEKTTDRFVVAPGVRGMVMAVFTMPSLGMVFKIIKDHFDPPKQVSKAMVKDRYHLVKTHDRVGRMADTQEFSNLVLPRDRFCEELLEELLAIAGSTVKLVGDQVLIRHMYAERRMVPLNLYLEQADLDTRKRALEEYGNAIKQLAAANIFPGDMLLKNFGVTRHGRVVFYDYDEISYLTDCKFRDIPEPLYPEQELSAEPWYSVSPNDIFPEEFPTFLFPDRDLRSLFTELHSDLFTAGYWRGIQAKIRQGQVVDVFPYRRSRRFDRFE
ncbi:MAG: bifunctional isocitrate dehydrogenase kinase/phosphatase [Endozoicomonas sp.]